MILALRQYLSPKLVRYSVLIWPMEDENDTEARL
jgi:hypothetical protein